MLFRRTFRLILAGIEYWTDKGEHSSEVNIEHEENLRQGYQGGGPESSLISRGKGYE
jgi:hypothetical protein